MRLPANVQAHRGLGELLFDRNGIPYDEMPLLSISEKTDSLMTHWPRYTQAEFDSLYSTIRLLNRSFRGPFDTLSFEAGVPSPTLALEGSVNLHALPFLKMP